MAKNSKACHFSTVYQRNFNLEVKLDRKRGFNYWYIERYLYFVVPVIMARKSKNPGKKKKNATMRGCNLRNVFVLYIKFLEITDLWPYFEFHENSLFQMF